MLFDYNICIYKYFFAYRDIRLYVIIYTLGENKFNWKGLREYTWDIIYIDSAIYVKLLIWKVEKQPITSSLLYEKIISCILLISKGYRWNDFCQGGTK